MPSGEGVRGGGGVVRKIKNGKVGDYLKGSGG